MKKAISIIIFTAAAVAFTFAAHEGILFVKERVRKHHTVEEPAEEDQTPKKEISDDGEA